MPNNILKDTNRSGLNVYLQSDNASISKGDADKVFIFQDFISVPPDQNILVGMTNFEMANTLYNINQGFNTITVNSTSGSHQITLTPKNYDFKQMLDTLNLKFTDATFLSNTGLTSLVVSFDKQNFKYTFTGNISFSIIECSFDSEIGLENQIPTNSQSGLGGYIFYDEPENHYFICNRREINTLEVVLTDDKDRQLVLNGGQFSITLSFHYVYKRSGRILSEYYLEKEKVEKDKNNIEK